MLRYLWPIFFLGQTVFAASQVRINRPVTVYSKPDFESAVAFSLPAGATISVGDKPVRGFRKIRATVSGQKRIGYIPLADFSFQKDLGSHGPWGGGGGILFTRLSQAAKSFSTSDQVTYTTTEYTSQSFNLGLFGQYQVKDFWRAWVAMRTVEYRANAALNVPGAGDQAIEVGYRFIAVGGQKAWTLFTDWFYLGVGLEAAKAISSKVKIGNQDLSGKSEAPTYMSVHGMAGVQYEFSGHYSVGGELRLGVVGNQSPTISVIEVVSTFMYWP